VSFIKLPMVLMPKRSRLGRPSALVSATFLAPAIALLGLFLLYPLISSFRLSTLDWNGLGATEHFIGAQNWIHLVHDPAFFKAVRNNLILAVFSVLIQMPIALTLAVMLDKAGRGSRTLKILYFLPLLMSSVAIGVVFKNVYDPNFGPLNAALNALGFGNLAQDWLGDGRFALGATLAVICWQNIPFYMILFMAGLSSLSPELREAARLDGASPWRIFCLP
jgi:raffinose/stachyose/melibiose transport system permease protein